MNYYIFDGEILKLFNVLFIFTKAALFANTVLKIEGDDITAIEVAHEMNELEEPLKQRKADRFLTPPAAAEWQMLIECGYNADELTAVCDDFYGNFSMNFNY